MDKYSFVIAVLAMCATALSLQPNKLIKIQVGHYIKTGKWRHVMTSSHIKNPIYVDVVSKYKLPPRSGINKNFIDCAHILKREPWRKHRDGVYTIYFKGSQKRVFCDMTTEGGGWTVIQKRFNYNESFDRNWNDYKTGFGMASGEYWIGNEEIHFLTSKNNQELRVNLKTKSKTGFAKYSTFKVDSESNKYMLTVGGYSGNAGDGLKGVNNGAAVLNGMYFSTKDNDNDKGRNYNCAANDKGGWWHNFCYHAFLNSNTRRKNFWYSTKWTTTSDPLQASTMMIRPT